MNVPTIPYHSRYIYTTIVKQSTRHTHKTQLNTSYTALHNRHAYKIYISNDTHIYILHTRGRPTMSALPPPLLLCLCQPCCLATAYCTASLLLTALLRYCLLHCFATALLRYCLLHCFAAACCTALLLRAALSASLLHRMPACHAAIPLCLLVSYSISLSFLLFFYHLSLALPCSHYVPLVPLHLRPIIHLSIHHRRSHCLQPHRTNTTLSPTTLPYRPMDAL